MRRIFTAVFLMPFTAFAQSSVPTEFPADATPMSAEDIRQALGGKLITANLADGSSWRLDIKSNGYIFLNTSKGFRDDGTWKAEDGKFCSSYKRVTASCNEVRKGTDAVFLKRDNGEVVPLVAQ